MSDKLSTLSATDVEEFKTLKAELIEIGKRIGNDSREFLTRTNKIETRDLWQAEYKTRQEFIADLAAAIGRSGRTVYDMLETEKTRFRIVKQIETVAKSDGSLAKALKTTLKSLPSKAVRALGKAPLGKEAEVLKKITAATVPAIEAAVKVVSRVEAKEIKVTDKSTWPKDSTGHPVPPPAWPFWERRNEVQPDLNQISEIKVRIQKAKDSGDSLYSWIGTPAIDALQNAYTTIANAKLTNVCTKCEGWWDRMTGGGCSTCHNTGLLSKHQFDVCSPKEIKDIREKANRARA